MNQRLFRYVLTAVIMAAFLLNGWAFAPATAKALPPPSRLLTQAAEWAPVNQSFQCATATNWKLLGDAVLTGDGAIDPLCSGWLQLTITSTAQVSSAIYDVAIPSSDGFVATFQYATYGGDGADGFAFYLIDGATLTPTLGNAGGELGYGGITNGYLGIGFDEMGNFSTGGGGPGGQSNAVVLRGSGSLETGFNYLAGFQLNNLSTPQIISTGNREDARWVRVFVIDNRVTVQMDFGAGWEAIITDYDLDTAPGQATLPDTFKLGFSGGTGSLTNYHEIRNLTVVKAINLGINETAEPTLVTPGNPVTFTTTINNHNINDALGVVVSATVPAQLSDVTWACTASGGSSCGHISGSGAISESVNLRENGTLIYTIQAIADGPAGVITHTTAVLPHPTYFNLEDESGSATVIMENIAPVADAGPDGDAELGQIVTLDGSGSSDSNGDDLIYAWAQSGGEAVALNDATVTSPTFTAPTVIGLVLTFTLTVTDTLGEVSLPDTVVITTTNEPPLANAGPDQTVKPGVVATLNGSASSDPGNHVPLAFGWEQTGGPSVVLSDATAISPTFTAPNDPTTLTFQLTVTDTYGVVSEPDEVIVSVGIPGYASSPAAGSSINLGTANIGATITTSLTISETGNAMLIVDSLTISGTNAADFSISTTSFSIVEGGAAQVVTIACTPSGSGMRTATLTVTHNADGSPAIYALTCTVQRTVYLPIIIAASSSKR